MSVFNSTHSIDIVAVYIHLNEFLIGHFVKYDMMRYIPSNYRKFVFCNINTNISIYRKKTRAHVQNRPHVTVGAKIAVLCSRTNIAERTQAVGIIRAGTSIRQFFFKRRQFSIQSLWAKYLHNGNVEDLGRLPNRRVTTPLHRRRHVLRSAIQRSAMLILAMFYVSMKTSHEQYISIEFDKSHVVHEEPIFAPTVPHGRFCTRARVFFL